MYISNATGYVVQEAYKLDFISDTANAIGKNIQTLAGVTESGFSTQGFYVGFLLLLVLIVGIYVAYTGLLKRETTKAVHAVVNFLVVFLLSASFIAYAPNYISKINDFSSDISSAALTLGTKITLPDSSSQGKDSVDLIRNSLFSIQVQQPWLLLQYGNSDIDELGADRVESLLSASPDTDTREDIVVEEIEDKDNANLSVTKTMSRLGTVVFLFLFNIGISIFVFLLTGMMIFSQVLFIIYAMFLPVSFILSMIPTYESMGKAKSNVSDFKRGIVEECTARQQGRATKQDSHRQTIAEKRMEMERAKPTGTVTKRTAPVHERPVTKPVSGSPISQTTTFKSQTEPTLKGRPTVAGREKQTTVKIKEPAPKAQEIRTQVMKEPVSSGSKSVRQSVTQKSVQKNVERNTVKKSIPKKGRKK